MMASSAHRAVSCCSQGPVGLFCPSSRCVEFECFAFQKAVIQLVPTVEPLWQFWQSCLGLSRSFSPQICSALHRFPRGMPRTKLAAQEPKPALLLPVQEPFSLKDCHVGPVSSSAYIKFRRCLSLQDVLFPRAKFC